MTARWWTGRALGLDFETDSADPEDARIIQWATIRVVNSESEGWSGIVKPERPIPEEAANIHGIGTERAEAEGAPREDAVRTVVDAIVAHTGVDDDGTVSMLVGHNVGSYDLTVLDREMRRTGIGSLGINQGFRLDGKEYGAGLVTVRIDGKVHAVFTCLDTLVLDRWVDKYRSGSRKLEDVAKHYRVGMDGSAHDAAIDATASLRIAWRIAKLCAASSAELFEAFADRRRPSDVVAAYTSIAHYTPDEIHRLQIGAAAEQAESLRQYWIDNPSKAKGDPNTVYGDWPFRPYI